MSTTILLQTTNQVLDKAARFSNKTIELDKPFSPKSSPLSKEIKVSQRSLLKLSKKLKNTSNKDHHTKLSDQYKENKINHRKLLRSGELAENVLRDKKLFDACSSTNHGAFHKGVRNAEAGARKIQKLKVRDRTYIGDTVPDGFYDSISKLKSREADLGGSFRSFHNFSEDYKNFLPVFAHSSPIPPISEIKTM